METSNLATPITPDSCPSSSSTSSAPQYSDDIRKTALQSIDLLTRKGSASSTKTCEVDLGDEERDTFSPVSSNNSSDDNDNDILRNCSGDAGPSSTILTNLNKLSASNKDNKHLEDILPPLKLKNNSNLTNNLHPTPSKEEKQRQNEEIVILETSSISSETGSWESVFPHSVTVTATGMNSVGQLPTLDTHNINLGTFCVTDFMQPETALTAEQLAASRLNEERELGAEVDTLNMEIPYASIGSVTAHTSSLFRESPEQCLNRELLLEAKRDDPLTTSQTSNCFIDASSLGDEDEIPVKSGETHKLQKVKQMKEENKSISVESPTKQLEDFHRSFARCKAKTTKEEVTLKPSLEQQRSNSSSSSSSDEVNDSVQNHNNSGGGSVSNLSDEEKLWKRERHHYETGSEPSDNKSYKRNYTEQPENVLALDEVTEASVSLVHDLDSSDSSELIKLRRENERKFPLYNYHTNILPPLPSKLLHNNQPATSLVNAVSVTHHSDLSYTTDYSSSSPVPSLVWSEHEHQRPGSHTRSALNEDYEINRKKSACLMPDTPHNSIVHIEPTSSNNSSIHRDYTLSSSLSHNRDSGAYCSDATDSPVPMPRTPKRTKFDEANPIISGGSCIKDFQMKQCDSPTVKRKTDTCPIVSGGFVSLDFECTRPQGDGEDMMEDNHLKPVKLRKPISGIASWVVDMSDCQQNERRKSTSSTSSIEAFQSKFRERSDSNSSHKSSCGFYVSLNECDKNLTKQDAEVEVEAERQKDEKAKQVKSAVQMSKSYDAPTSTKFFINLSASEYNSTEKPRKQNSVGAKTEEQESENNSQKNLFSMFIDIGNGEKRPSPRPTGRKEPFHLTEKLSSQRKMEDIMKSSASSTETIMSKSMTQHMAHAKDSTEVTADKGETKSLDYSVNIEPPTTVAELRRSSREQQQRTHIETTKRHSWSINSNNDSSSIGCKRSISLMNNNEACHRGLTKGLMSIIDKIPIISKTSSISIDSSVSPQDEYTGSKSELSITSFGGEIEEVGASGEKRVKKRRQDVKINETFDKSSLASITDGIISKDLSPMSNTDTDDLTFQQDEEQALRDIAALEEQQQLSTQQQPQQILPPTVNSTSSRMSSIIMETIVEAKEISSPKQGVGAISLETLHATIEKQKKLLETVNEHAEVEKSNFVKLSDMDKPVKANVKSPDRMSTSVGNHRQISRVYRDDNRIRPHSWTMTRSTGNSFLNITSSVENMRSLSRLFPNFSKEISNSLPNDVGLDNVMDYVQTDLSADSSLASSISRSGMDESSLSCRQPRRLGEDLLKMFLQEVATDMIVEVHGRRIKAHKCILRSRCQYFAAMLAGINTTSVVSLQGYSYSAVHFALCHIYSGASHPPDGISLMELAALADLLGLEGLKEVTSHALKTNYCHNFHKPCSGCIDGILQVLPVALNHALDDLYRKCLRWTCRHYLKVWPTRQFAQLPSDVLARCRQQIVAYLTSETVLDAVLDCENLLAQLATYRWGGVCENMVRDILEAAYAYMADHFASLIASDSFLSLGHDRSCHIPLLEAVLLRTASSLTPDQACRSYQRITRLNTVLQAKIIQMPASLGELVKELQGLQEEDLEWNPEYIRLISALLSAIEQCLIRQCSRAMRITSWQRMDLDLRKKIQTLARLTEPVDLKRNRGVSKAFSFGGSTRSQDLQQVKLAIQAHTKKSLPPDMQLYKATQTQESVQTTEKAVQANHYEPREGRVPKTNSRAHVPSQCRGFSQSTIASDRNSSSNLNANNHRRTKSEAPAPTDFQTHRGGEAKRSESGKIKMQPLKLTDVRPRYLEPKRTAIPNTSQGPVRSSTSSSIPPGGNMRKSYTHSSSESSRRSSPAARRQVGIKITGIKSTTNMSLDSLASSANRTSRCKTSRSSDNDRFSDVFVDSLESINNINNNNIKTISRESLNTQRLVGNKLKSQQQRHEVNKIASNGSNDKIEKNKNLKNPVKKPLRPTSLGAKPTKYMQHKITSTGSSPSSVTTTKSATSRLSSVSSTQSARGGGGVGGFYKRSTSVPGHNETQVTPKISFLSAKSREILARRAEKNKQQQQEQPKQNKTEEKNLTNAPTVTVMRSASHNSVITARNLSMPSNIPTRRPNTLQLKKNCSDGGGLIISSSSNKNNKTASTTRNTMLQQKQQQQHISQNAATQAVYQTAQAVKQKIELLIKSSNNIANDLTRKSSNDNNDQQTSITSESKLERSSTFCKESAEVGVDINELHIIE